MTSEFKGSAMDYLLIRILASIITMLTFGLGYPFAYVMKQTYFINNSYIEGKQLFFDGKAMQLLGNWIKWWLLTVVTFGIYGILFVDINLKAWEVKHTHFK